MKIKKIESNKEEITPNKNHISFIYFCYISLALIILTDIMNIWTALASLATFFLILICPFITAFIAYKNYKKIKISTKHKNLFYFSLLYSIGIPISIIVIRLIIHI